MFKLGETFVCFKAFREILGLPDRTVRHWQAGIQDGIVHDDSASRCSVKASVTTSWLQKYARQTGDRQPDKPVYHLPATLWKKDVYEEFVAAHSDLQQVIPSQVLALHFEAYLVI